MEENRELIEKAVSYIDSGCKIAEVSVEEVAQNALPFDDSQFGANAIEHGGFEATDLGFLRVLTTYHISF